MYCIPLFNMDLFIQTAFLESNSVSVKPWDNCYKKTIEKITRILILNFIIVQKLISREKLINKVISVSFLVKLV
jgi:hypothetical protein